MRVVQRVLAAVLALVLLAGGVLVAAEIAWRALLGRERKLLLPWQDWRDDAAGTPWSDDDPLQLIFILMVVAGAILLIVPLIKRKPTAVPLVQGEQGASSELDRKGLENWLESRLGRVDGAVNPRVRVQGRDGKRVVVRASTPGRDTATVERDLQSSADASLGQLGLARQIPVRVSVASQRQEA